MTDGLFGISRKMRDTYAGMGAGMGTAAASGQAMQMQDARMAQSEAMKRQAGMDDLTRRYKESQIRSNNMGNNSSTNDIRNTEYLRKARILDAQDGGTREADFRDTSVDPQYKLINDMLSRIGVDSVENLENLPEKVSNIKAVAAAKSYGVEEGKEDFLGSPTDIAREKGIVDAKAELPGVETKGAGMLKALTDMRDHPGMSAVIGLPNYMEGGFGSMGNLPGTPAADFSAILDQVKGGVFMEAYQELKGGGQITEVEGKKAEQAKTTMTTPGISEEAFNEARETFIEVIINGVKKARMEAGGDGNIDDLLAVTAVDNKSRLQKKYKLIPKGQ